MISHLFELHDDVISVVIHYIQVHKTQEIHRRPAHLHQAEDKSESSVSSSWVISSLAHPPDDDDDDDDADTQILNEIHHSKRIKHKI